MRLIWIYLNLIFWTFLFGFSSFIVISISGRKNFFKFFGLIWGKTLSLIFNVKLTVKGKNNLSSHGNYIFSANHASIIDIPLLLIATNRYTVFIAKKELSKKHQVSDWSQRPLSSKQLQYAANDVRYLAKIYKILSNELTRRKKKKKFSEEIKKLDSIKDIYKIESAWKKIRINKRKSVDLNLLKKIAKWREKKAQSLNLPRNWIVSDKILIKAAKKIKTSELKEFSKNKKLNSYLKDFIFLLEAKKFI